MYKLLIVDDEEIEREGMACFIPWEDYEVQLVGTAWNGVDGLEQIRKTQPDIVFTDIKMPVMNGIELIRAVKKENLNIEFIVLSGYGEYEYTSQAMELGVRHYLLKPCDENKIMAILEKVKKEIESQKCQKEEVKNYRQAVKTLLPKAKEQILRNLLLERTDFKETGKYLFDDGEEEKQNLRVIGFKEDGGFDELEQFILGNVLRELVGEARVLESACIGQEILFLLKDTEMEWLEAAVKRIRESLIAFSKKNLLAAVSTAGAVQNLGKQYIEIKELFRISYIFPEGDLLAKERFQNGLKNKESVFDSYCIQKADSFEKILFEVYLMFLKMKIEDFDKEKIEQVCKWSAKLIGIPEWEIKNPVLNEWELIVSLTTEIAKKNLPKCEEEEDKMRKILLVIYQHLNRQDLSIQYISKEVLYMNEEYFGRLFFRHMKQKFSVFVVNRRIALAKRLLLYCQDIKLSQVASILGYAPDGQYFSKVFRKQMQMSPKEYREKIKQGEIIE